MTSIVDRYYRKILQNIDNVTMKFDISTLLVKSKEHDSKIDDLNDKTPDNLTKTIIRSLIITNKITNISEIDNLKSNLENI